MFKKIFLLAMMILPFKLFAQEAKIAYVNSEEIISAMPETAAMQTELDKLSNAYKTDLKGMEDEFNRKYTALMQQQDSLPDAIKTRRYQEISDLRQRTQTYQQQAQDQFTKKQQDLLTPIQQKVLDTIKQVAQENGYTYVLEKGAFLYVSPSAIDATPLIKKKLNLSDRPRPVTTPSTTRNSSSGTKK